MSRTHFSQLPQSEELVEIMQEEACRPVPPGREGAHFVEFLAIAGLLSAYGLPAEFFETTALPEKVVEEGVLEKGEALMRDLAERVLAGPPDAGKQDALNSAYAYLAEEDALEPADLIFVFGAKTFHRIEKAVELYRSGLAPRLVISGGNPFYSKGLQETEAARYADIAMAAGVPRDAIILESEAITVADNVRRSLNLLDEAGVAFRSVILVNSPYVQRRGWASFMKYLPDGVSVSRANCDTVDKYRDGEWWKNEEGLKVVLNEWVKLKVAVSLNTA